MPGGEEDKKPAAPRVRGLGRGLSALLGDEGPASGPGGTDADTPQRLPIALLAPTPLQPRRIFSDEAISDLAASIHEKGILQPLLVRPAADGRRYEIVAGERRWRAAQKAKVHDAPVIVRELTDEEVLQVAIIENVQRENLSPVEEARAYRDLNRQFGHNQEAIAKMVGKSRSHVANLMRLLGLPKAVLDRMDEGALSMGHARALIGADDPARLAKKVIGQGLSVRQTEKLARDGGGEKSRRRKTTKDADTRALEKSISAALKMPVEISHAGGKGRVSIRYSSLDELDKLCQCLMD